MFDNVDLSPVAVAGLSSDLNGCSAAGSGTLHPYMLKACSDASSFPLYLPFVRSLSDGALPTVQKW